MTKLFQVLTDSTSDIEKEYRDQYGLDYLKMVFDIAGKHYEADLDWPEIKPDDYYNLMRDGERSVTGLVQTTEVETKFNKYLSEGFDVLYITCSSKLSGSINQAKLLASEFIGNYPGKKVICLDSLRSNYAEAMIAMKAAELANEGKTIDEAVAIIEEEKLKYQTYATVGTLDYLRKAGRVKASKAFFGNLFGVKPIILGDAHGNNYAYKKMKGRKASLDELVNTVVERIENPENQVIYLEQANCMEDAEYIKEELIAKINPKEVHISALGPIIGATCGPDAITINFYGQKVEIFDPEN